MNNLLYWLRTDIDSKTWWTLKRIGDKRPPKDRIFETAYLIAIDCVTPDMTVTDKGHDCLEFFRQDYSPDPRP